jgi:hypothetical protein
MLVENTCLSVFLHLICLSTLWPSSYPYLSLKVTSLQFNFLSKILWNLFSIRSNSPTAVNISVCKSSNNNADKKNCPHIVCVPLFKLCTKSGCNCMTSCHGRTCLSFPIHRFISYVHPLQSQSL